ncbi:hypothetical protein V4D30_06275 [Thermodesulfovibrio sp. 3907-1M]|uniref:DUF1640 domain-containing protein n=1 Tax=Thermodesulfovibrio autotrophicus TaxID=3118333 RepID=A0AAU8GTR4_9BACT
MPVTEIEVYEALKQQVGENSVKTLLEFIDILAIKQDIANLEVKIEQVRAELIRWMFIFWADQIGALVSILALFFK